MKPRTKHFTTNDTNESNHTNLKENEGIGKHFYDSYLYLCHSFTSVIRGLRVLWLQNL